MQTLADNLVVFGNPEQGAIEQIQNCMSDPRAVKGALMADNHKGYSMPIGGVIAYEDAVSPSGVGFDIGCGNKAVKTNLHMWDFFEADEEVPERKLIDTFKPYMRNIQKSISFGLGRTSGDNVDHPLFDNSIWTEIEKVAPGLKFKAEQQLGTVGSGNHYVDLLYDIDDGTIWVANHFGSRGLGHTVATGFLNLAKGAGFKDRLVETEDPTVIPTDTDLGQFYIEAMKLAGEYAYAGRDYVANIVVSLLGAKSEFEVHNHHNFAWLENGLWVVRKGATPLTHEPAFIGGSMGDDSVIVRGKWMNDGDHDFGPVTDLGNIGSAPHGAGRVMSRTAAAGKLRKMWVCTNRNCESEGRTFGRDTHPEGAQGNNCPNCGILLRKQRMRDTSSAAIDWPSVRYSLEQKGVVVLGAGADEAPGVYKNLSEVLAAHSNIEILHRLRPLGVVMAGEDVFDPFKD